MLPGSCSIMADFSFAGVEPVAPRLTDVADLVVVSGSPDPPCGMVAETLPQQAVVVHAAPLKVSAFSTPGRRPSRMRRSNVRRPRERPWPR